MTEGKQLNGKLAAYKGPVKLIESPWNKDGKVFAAVSCRGDIGQDSYHGLNLAMHVGDEESRVLVNRMRLAESLDADLSWHWLDQVHGTKVVEVQSDYSAQSPLPEADALVTSSARQACCVLTADCLPVFFYSRELMRVAVAHAGWRGLAAGVLEATLAEFGGRVESVSVWFGPAIGPCHFEVGEEVYTQFLNAANNEETAASLAAAFVPSSHENRFMADLVALATARLKMAGVRDLSGGNLCTYCDPNSFYSFRREPVCGRMASLIYIK